MREITIKIHAIAEDGLPDMATSDALTGRVAFFFDGNIVSGWPLGTGEDADGPYSGYWEANSDVGKNVQFAHVTHWVEFPVPLWKLENSAKEADKDIAAWWQAQQQQDQP